VPQYISINNNNNNNNNSNNMARGTWFSRILLGARDIELMPFGFLNMEQGSCDTFA
jgi:hypothetical protein